MKVLLLSARPLGAADIDRVLLTGFSPSAVDVCPTVHLAIARLDAFTPDLIIVNLPEPDAGDAVERLRERDVRIPTVVVASPVPVAAAITGPAPARPPAPGAVRGGAAAHDIAAPDGDTALLTADPHAGIPGGEGTGGGVPESAPPMDARLTDAALAEARDEIEQLARAGVSEALDSETRWLLYEVAAIGHVSTTPDGRILSANDIAAQLLGHFSSSVFEAAGSMPQPLVDVAGAFARRPSRFELCLQHGEDGPLHWIVGLAVPQAGAPGTVTWFLIDVSEQRLQARRSRFLRRMDALTHVLAAATAECSTLLDTGGHALTVARDRLADDVDVEQAVQALSRARAVLAQLSGFARRRARRPVLKDLRALIEQMSAVLVHATGDEIAWSMHTGDSPLYVSLDAAELEQCLSALVTQAREALPLGGRMRLALEPVLRDASQEEGRGTRPEVRMTIELQGYGLQAVTTPQTLETQLMRLGVELTTAQPDHLTTQLVLALPRVFLTA